MSANDWLLLIGLGAASGIIGQVARMIVGLKKMTDKARTAGVASDQLFRRDKLLISLLIGAVAGAIAAISTTSGETAIGKDFVLALAAAGYAGADFIEGVMKRFVPAE